MLGTITGIRTALVAIITIVIFGTLSFFVLKSNSQTKEIKLLQSEILVMKQDKEAAVQRAELINATLKEVNDENERLKLERFEAIDNRSNVLTDRVRHTKTTVRSCDCKTPSKAMADRPGSGTGLFKDDREAASTAIFIATRAEKLKAELKECQNGYNAATLQTHVRD